MKHGSNVYHCLFISVHLSEDQIFALAPDEASKKSGKELASSAKWVSKGISDVALWGECQGSGSKPYRTQIDILNLAFKCSCPGRKFPCKHELGLLLLYSRINENIFKTGIEKLSNSKEFTDDEYMIYQLMKSVPPTFWETQLSFTPENIIQSFQKEKDFKKFIPALVMSVTHFKGTRWAISFMQHSEVFYIDFIPLLPVKQQEHYSVKFFDQHEQSIIQYATMRENEWSVELTKAIFK